VTTFALIHGAWHGAWCWERLLAPLRERGHGVIAVDLPSDDPAAGLDAHADAVAGFLVEDDVVVVEEDARWAFERLRPQAPTTQREPQPAGAQARATSIVGARDAAVNPEWSRRVARERLGADPVEIDTGHFPMIAAPGVLADALSSCA
jgi:pimeloyl-ACP methyl ester carboxylesterase